MARKPVSNLAPAFPKEMIMGNKKNKVGVKPVTPKQTKSKAKKK